MFDKRSARINVIYGKLAAAAGLAPGRPRDRDIWRQATEIVDAELYAEAMPASAKIWASELAGEAEELLADVAAGMAHVVNDPSSLALSYARARTALYQAKLAESGQDVCRSCERVRPATDVKLVLIYKVTDVHWQDLDELKHEQEFAILCGFCRTEKPPEQVSLRQAGCPPIVAEVFTRIYEASEINGTFWVKIKDEGRIDDYDLAVDGFTSQPGTARTGPPPISPGLAERLGVPPVLDVVRSGGSVKVVIRMQGYNLDLLAREKCRAELLLPVGAHGWNRSFQPWALLASKNKMDPATTIGAGSIS